MMCYDAECLFCDEIAVPYDQDQDCALCVRHALAMLTTVDEDDFTICIDAELREEHCQATRVMVPQEGDCCRTFCYEHADAIINIYNYETFAPAWEFCIDHAADNYLARMHDVTIINGHMYDIDEDGY